MKFKPEDKVIEEINHNPNDNLSKDLLVINRVKILLIPIQNKEKIFLLY